MCILIDLIEKALQCAFDVLTILFIQSFCVSTVSDYMPFFLGCNKNISKNNRFFFGQRNLFDRRKTFLPLKPQSKITSRLIVGKKKYGRMNIFNLNGRLASEQANDIREFHWQNFKTCSPNIPETQFSKKYKQNRTKASFYSNQNISFLFFFNRAIRSKCISI